MRRLKATLGKVPPHCFFAQHDIDQDKAAEIKAHLKAGGSIPPVVVVKYGKQHMPIDGHHRLYAAQGLDMEIDGWIVPGEKFEALDQKCRQERDFERAEDYIMCGGVPAMMVAPRRYS